MPRTTTFDRNVKPTLDKLISEVAWIERDPTNAKKLVVSTSGEVVFEVANRRNVFYFRNRNQDTGVISDRYGSLKKIDFGNDLNLAESVWINRNGYKLAYYKQMNEILGFQTENINTIELKRGNRTIKIENNIVKTTTQKFVEILSDASSISQKGGSQRNIVERYLSKISREKFFGVQIRDLTLTRKGEFAFLIDRLNLSNKHKKADYDKFVDNEDIEKIQLMTQNFLQNEVFSPDFRRRLDEYFIKEKLLDIIKIGDEILKLGLSDMTTDKAKETSALVSDEPIKQLETLWQKYFEKYLLYLVYSYQKFFPKLELDLEGDEKLPDFVGINHYDGVDIIEIKTHLKHALTYDSSHKNFAFSTELSKAIIQVTNYMDALVQDKFTRAEDRRAITTLTGEAHVYRPRAIIIISSSDRLVSRQSQYDKNQIVRDFTKLRNSLHNIEILTFDEVISMARRYKENIATE